MKTISLQKQLLKSTLITTLLLGVLGFGLISFLLAFDDNNIFDDLLEANATSLLGDSLNAYPDIEQGLYYLNEQMDIEYQIINEEGLIINKTLNAPNRPFVLSFSNHRYYNSYADGQWWRVYTLYSIDKHRYVQIAQPYLQRLDFILPKIKGYFLGVGAFIGVLIVVNALVIKKSLKPLSELKNHIDKKHLQELSPIHPAIHLSEISPLISAINELFDRLHDANLSQERFVADASHELRTPLAGIAMKVQLLQRKFADKPDLLKEIAKLEADSQRAVVLVENLLWLARLDNVTTNHYVKTDLIWVDDWLTQAIYELPPSDWSPIIVLKQGDNVQIQANLPLLIASIHNVVNNAILYGGGNAKLPITVEIQAHQTGNVVEISIKDNGVGVSDEHKKRLGERFFRVLGNQKLGSGLGLSIVAKILEKHGGTLSFDNGLDNGLGGFGLGVVLTLPIALPHPTVMMT